jgi:protein TonB
MLDQLVESKNNSKESVRMMEFVTVIGVTAMVILLSGWTYSLFAKDYGMGSGDLELSTLVAPPPPEDEPPPKPEVKPEQQKQVDADVRKELIQNIMSSPVKPPDVIKMDQSTVKAMRENTLTVQGSNDANTGTDVGRNNAGVTNDPGKGGLAVTPTTTDAGDGEAPPPPPKPTPKPVPKTVSGGVLNGKATSLPQPPYPAAAKAVRAMGSVTVQILIDENGRVVSASAVNGHPLLRQAAESAARGARFSPTLLSGQPVKVSGVITYNFTL